MTVDTKTASHICNVIRRQIQQRFPDLYIHFIIHGENKRSEAFNKDIAKIKEHLGGQAVINFFKTDIGRNQLYNNRSQFSCIGQHHTHGFLGFFKNNAYFAVGFINIDRFSSVENLRNHASHLIWHILQTYRTHAHPEQDILEINITDENDVLTPNYTNENLYHNNLMADIFSACHQTVNGRKDALSIITRQRMHDTVTPEIGFIAENFPFPVCVDTLKFMLKNQIDPNKKIKNPLDFAISMTQDIGRTHDKTAVEQWRSFSCPAQEMAWLGHPPERILGAALYTSENTYEQSIADSLAESLDIKPEFITSLDDFNPYTNTSVNKRLHTKLCNDLIDNILPKIHSKEDHSLFLDVAKKQNMKLLQGSTMGWCVPSLLRIKYMIQKCDNQSALPETLKQAHKIFTEDIENTPWETLVHLSKKIIFALRDGERIDDNALLTISQTSDEFTTIGYAMTQLHDLVRKENQITDLNPTPKNISDFISVNAIKR